MASTTFLAEVRLRFLFELDSDCGSSDCVIAGDGLAKSGAVAGNKLKMNFDSYRKKMESKGKPSGSRSQAWI